MIKQLKLRRNKNVKFLFNIFNELIIIIIDNELSVDEHVDNMQESSPTYMHFHCILRNFNMNSSFIRMF